MTKRARKQDLPALVKGGLPASASKSVLHRAVREHSIALGVLFLALGIFYFGFLGGKCFLWEDLLYMIHPAFNYLVTSLASGRFPLWLSGLRCGIPFFSEPWVYYPPIWGLSFWVRDGHLPSLAVQWFFVGQLFLGGLFAYLFLRDYKLSLWACISGMVVFVFSAFLTLHIIHGGMGHAFLWLPLELLFVKRIMERRQPGRNYIYLILGIWMSFLAGFPQSVLYNAYFLAAFWLYMAWQTQRLDAHSSRWWWLGVGLRECIKVVAVFAGVGLLGAFVIASTVQSWGMSFRQEFGFAQIADLSLPWYYLVHGLVPNFFGAVHGDGGGAPFWGFNKDALEYGAWMYWEFGFYAGQLALITIVVMAFNVRRLWTERRDMVFFLAALPVLLCLMLGRYGGLFNLLYHLAPGFSMFRAPARFSGLFDFSAAVLTAMLVDSLWRGRSTLKLRWPLWTLGGIYGVLFLGILVYGNNLFPALSDPRLLQHALLQIGVSLVLFAGMAVLLVWIKRLADRRQDLVKVPEGEPGGIARWLVWALIALTFLDLYLAFHQFHQGRANPEEYYADRNGVISQMTRIREQQGPFRIAQLRDRKISEEVVFPRNIGYLYSGYEALEGYILFNLKDYGYFNVMTNEGARLDIENVGIMANLDSRTRQVSLSRYTNSLPRAKFYHEIRAYDESKTLYADLDSGRLDYHRTLGILREDCAKYGVMTSAPPAHAEARVKFIPVNPDEYRISYETSAPGVIFVSESFYPGWQADGGRYPVIRAFGAFKGIVIPAAGSGEITVKFSPKVLWLGLAISGLSFTLLMVALVVTIRRDKRSA